MTSTGHVRRGHWACCPGVIVMKRRDAVLLGAAAGVALGGVGWVISRLVTAPRGVEPIEVGDRFPAMVGHRLSGASLSLPDDLRGDAGVLIVTWDYAARADLTAWRQAVMELYGLLPGVQVFEVAMVQDVSRVFAPVVRRLLISSTPVPEQEHVLLVYGDLRPLRLQLHAEPTAVPHATVFLIDREGRLAWRADGQPTPDRLGALRGALADIGVVEG